MQSCRSNFQFRQIKYMLLTITVNYDSKNSGRNSEIVATKLFAQSHQKDL